MTTSNKIQILIALCTIFTTISNGQSPILETVCAESREYYGVTGTPGSSFAWAVETGGGIIVQGDGEDSILVQWGYDIGTYQIEVVELTSSGCVGVPVMARVPVQAPEVDLGFDFYEICYGESEQFDASGDYDGESAYLWQDGSTLSTYTADTTENIWVRVTDARGCFRYDSIEFTAHNLPVVSLGNDTIFCHPDNALEIDAGDFVAYEWSSHNGESFTNPYYVYRSVTYVDTVSVLVTDNNNCIGTDTMLVFPCDAAALFIDMVNTFTPDGDGVNDTWTILKEGNMSQFPNAILEVFDRWGRLVYRTENVADQPWDGTSKGRDMPMDAYFFVLELNFGGFEAITGTVNLIR